MQQRTETRPQHERAPPFISLRMMIHGAPRRGDDDITAIMCTTGPYMAPCSSLLRKPRTSNHRGARSRSHPNRGGDWFHYLRWRHTEPDVTQRSDNAICGHQVRRLGHFLGQRWSSVPRLISKARDCSWWFFRSFRIVEFKSHKHTYKHFCVQHHI